MKSKIFITIALLFSTTYLFSQSNKPNNAFGIGYGISFGNNFTHSIRFSHWTKKNIEYGTELSFNYNYRNNTASDSIVAATNSFPFVETFSREVVDKSKQFNIQTAPFAVYHFKVPTNLDIYAGIALPFGTSINGALTNTATINEVNYFRKEENSIESPNTYSIGALFRAGTNFFFYKNLAFGASFNVGFTNLFSKGTSMQEVTIINSGSNNPFSGSQTNVVFNNEVNNKQGNFGFSGNAVFSLTYYFSSKKELE